MSISQVSLLSLGYCNLLAILAPFIIILIAFSAYGLGSPIIRHFDKPGTLIVAERVLFSGLIGATILAGCIWLVGIFRYDITSMSALLTIALMLAVIFQRKAAKPIINKLAWRTLIPNGAWRLVPFAIVIILFVGFIGAYAPPADHDTIRYQLLLPERNLIWGKIRTEFGWSIYEFLPPLGAMLTHLVYPLAGSTGAQLLNLLWQIVAAGTAATLTFRLSQRMNLALLAALFLLSQRVSINLASTVSVEFTMASYAGGALLGALVFLRRPNISMAILMGLLIGGLVNVKHHGLVYAACIYLPIFFISIRRRELRYPLFLSGIIAFSILLPWLIRNGVVTGNPLFPAFHHLINQNNINLFDQILMSNKTGTDFLSIVLLPWNIFVDQQNFDGLQFGIPTLLLFLPFAFMGKYRQHLLLLIVIVIAYLSVWFIVMPHLIRFLVPLFPILCTLAALGAWVIAEATRGSSWKHGVILITVIGLGLAQTGFLLATGARRVPAALNLVSKKQYLESKPFIYYTQYSACRWVADHLAKDETYLALLNNPTFYCSITKAFPDLLPGDEKYIYTSTPRPATPPRWLSAQLKNCKVRYVILPINLGADSEPHVFAKHRYDSLIKAVTTKLNPVHQTAVAKIFSGADVANALLNLPVATTIHPIFQPHPPKKDGQCSVAIGVVSRETK